MIFLYFFAGIAFDLREPLKTAWNAEVVYPTLSGDISSTFYYNFNLTTQDDPDEFSAIIYEGNFTDSEDDVEEKKAVASLEIEMRDEQEGSIEFNNESTVDFKFVESFPYFLAAYGTYNQTYTYTVNIINLATVHISLFSLEKKLFREIILTRYQPTHENIPWYIKHNNIVVGGGVFVVTFIALHFLDTIKKFLGLKKDSNEEAKQEKDNNIENRSKPKEKVKKEKKKLN